MTGSRIRSRPPSAGGFDDFGFQLKAVGISDERPPNVNVEPVPAPPITVHRDRWHSRHASLHTPAVLHSVPTPKVSRLARLSRTIRVL
jgi:hypothetical protein